MHKKLLIEISAKELLDLNNRKNTFTPQFIKYVAFSFRTKTAFFKTGKYYQKIEFPALKVISRIKGTPEDKINIALVDDIKIFCNCYDFLYSGQKYMLWKIGAGIHKENRPPVKNNPNEDIFICKHMTYLLNNLNKYKDRITEDYIKSSKYKTTVIHDKDLQTKLNQLTKLGNDPLSV